MPILQSDTVAPNIYSNTITGSDGHQYFGGTTQHGGMTKYEHFMLEILKAIIASGYRIGDVVNNVNLAQGYFEYLRKRLSDIESKGLLEVKE